MKPGVVRAWGNHWMRMPKVKDFVAEAIEGHGFAGGNFEAAQGDIKGLFEDAKVGIFLGFEADAPKAISILILPHSKISPIPVWAHLYVSGSKGLTSDIIDASLDFLAANGYTSFNAINGSDASDDVWLRTLLSTQAAKRLKPEPKRLFSIVELELK